MPCKQSTGAMSPSWPPVRYATSKPLTFTRCRVKIAPSAAPIALPSSSCAQYQGSRRLMPPELDTLQLEERLVGSRVWLEPALGHRHREPDDVIFSRLSPLLQRHGGIVSVLVWDRPELSIGPLEHDGALGTGLVVRLQEDCGGVREVVTVLGHHVQTDGAPSVLRGGSNKDDLIGYT